MSPFLPTSRGVTLSNTPEQLNVVDEEIIPLSIPAIIVHGL